MPQPTLRVDAHQHFWQLARGDYGWLRPGTPSLDLIRRDYIPADLEPLLAAHGVVQTVLVQATDTEAETCYLLSLAQELPIIGGVVGWIDLSRAEAAETLARWADEPGASKLRAVRPMLQDLDQDDWITRCADSRVVRALVRHGLGFDALVGPRHLQPLLRFVQRWTELQVVIDHAAKPSLASAWGSAGGLDGWRRDMSRLAACANVHCKLSGLLTEASPPARSGGLAAQDALRPMVQFLLDAFGPTRLIWGSDWPVLNLACDYAEWVSVSEALLAPLSASEAAAVWGNNARRVYRLPAMAQAVQGDQLEIGHGA